MTEPIMAYILLCRIFTNDPQSADSNSIPFSDYLAYTVLRYLCGGPVHSVVGTTLGSMAIATFSFPADHPAPSSFTISIFRPIHNPSTCFITHFLDIVNSLTLLSAGLCLTLSNILMICPLCVISSVFPGRGIQSIIF